MGDQAMLFGKEIQLGRLSALGDPLEKINALIDVAFSLLSIKQAGLCWTND